MTPFPYSVDVAAPLARARALMAEHDIHHLPVKQGDRLVGAIALRDLGAPADDAGRTVRDVATTDPYVVDASARVDDVAFAMADRHIECVLVTREGHLAGLFTTTDVCRLLGERLRQTAPPPPDDVVA